MRLRFETVIIALFLSIVAASIAVSDWLWRLDMAIYDYQIGSWSRLPPGDILIVAIDDHSVAELGRWPWPRREFVDLVRSITDGGARVTALDVDFSVADPKDPESDALLAQAIAENSDVVLPVSVDRLRQGGQTIEVLPIPLLTDAAARLGHTDVDVDPDGFARVVPLHAGIGPTRWPSLAMAMLDVAERTDRQAPATVAEAGSRAESGFFWTRDDKILVPFAGPRGHFVQVSYVDIVRGAVPASVFKDKFVLVGVTASGLGEAFLVPTAEGGTRLSRVEFAANVLDAIRRDLAISPTTTTQAVAIAAALTFIFVFLYVARRASWIYLVFGAAMILVINAAALRFAHFWFDPMAPLVGFLCAAPVMMWRDRQQASQRRFEESQRAQVTLQSIADGVMTTDMRGQVAYMNTVAERLTGYKLGAAREQPLTSILRIVDEDQHELIDPIDPGAMQRNAIEPARDAILMGRTGRRHFIRLSVASLKSRRGRLSGYVITFSDSTDVRLLTKVLEHQSTHDAVTRLPNRILFHDRLAHGIATARREGRLCTVMLIRVEPGGGVDQKTRDEVLKAVGARLEAARREVDTAARLGGDEFVVLLESLPDEEAATALVFRILGRVDAPVVLGETEVDIHINTGVSVYPQDGDSIETLLGNAERAVAKASARPGSRVRFHSDHLNTRNTVFASLETSLDSVLEADEMAIAYQPVFNIRTSQIVGAEALLRWREGPSETPDAEAFLPIAQHLGVIPPLAKRVLERVAADAARWQDRDFHQPRVAMTISHREFLEPELATTIEAALRSSWLRPGGFAIEISESAIVDDAAHTLNTMHALKGLGLQLGIFGFGTGHASVSSLNRLPIDYVKLDPGLVTRAAENSDDAAFVQAIVSMAHGLKLTVVANGIETESQLAFVRAGKCDEVQGPLFGQPLPTDDIFTWIATPASPGALTAPQQTH